MNWWIRWSCGAAFLTVSWAQAADTILIDGRSEGRTFEGLGAVSAGASSRLLIDYPEPQRGEILDFLFLPNHGAALQHLKVEMGGDVNSTDGCEPSHMHERDDENCQRGYEWWLMKEAKKRNPDILLDCLAWGAPGWIGQGQFYSQDMADYVVRFIYGAKRLHRLDIHYTGIRNERRFDPSWIKLLRRTLNANGLRRVQIVAADEPHQWTILDAMAKDPAVNASVAVLGVHYPKSTSPDAAKTCGKPIWSSEDGPWSGRWAAATLHSASLPQLYNRNYAVGRMTKTLIWSPVTSYYDNLPLPGSGLMRAVEPWSGHYEVQPAIWMTAHTTQFAQPGWKYLDTACLTNTTGASVVALQSPNGSDYSVIIETIAATQPQTLAFELRGGLSTAPLRLWRSNAKQQFIHDGLITPTNGAFRLLAEAGSLYSLTTTTGQCKGASAPPPSRPFPLPYREDFESYPPGATPRYLSDQAGIFEVAGRADGNGKALRLATPRKGIEWQKMPDPETILGSRDWKDYEVSVDARIEKAGAVSLYGRLGKVPQTEKPRPGYLLTVRHNGEWQLRAAADPIAAGRVPFSPDAWHNLKLRFLADTITVAINGQSVATLTNRAFTAGMTGIGCGWHQAQFDNLNINPVTP